MNKIMKLVSVLSGASETLAGEIDFAEIVENIKDEVDSYHYILKRLDHEEAWLKAEIKALSKKRSRLRKNRRTFNIAIKNAMLFNEFQKLPGKRSKVFLKKTRIFEEKGPASLDLWEKFPWAINRKISYTWNKIGVLKKAKTESIDELQEWAEVKSDYAPIFREFLPKKEKNK